MKSISIKTLGQITGAITILLISLTFSLSSCSHGTRSPSSEGTQKITPPTDLLKGVQLFRQSIQGPDFTRESCAPLLQDIYTNLLRLPVSYFDTRLLKENSTQILQELFMARIEMREALARIEPASADCANRVRDIMRASNFIFEYIVENFTSVKGTETAFDGGTPALMVNPKFSKAPLLQSGDILLSRGNAHVSAAIARIGDTDGTYSHAALVYVDPNTQQKFVMEAHIEVGVVATPLNKYVADGKLRATVFRHKDATLAVDAAQGMYRCISRLASIKKTIPYNFSMVLGKDLDKCMPASGLFCSELPWRAYGRASKKGYLPGKHLTGLHMRNPEFKKAIGVTADETFAPSDMELEVESFDVVAEWRNFEKTQKARQEDMIFSRLFEYMETMNYVFDAEPNAFKRDFAYIARRLGLLTDKFPLYMTRKALGTMLAMDSTATPILTKLADANEAQRLKTGFAMTSFEMAQFIDQLRAEDAPLYEPRMKYEKEEQENRNNDNWYPPQPIPPTPLFHKSFHPRVARVAK